MVLQCFSDVTLVTKSGTSLHGPGERLELSLHEAVKVMLYAPQHFKIVAPLPLLPGVVVCWSLPDGRIAGPGTVLTVEGRMPHRMLSVTSAEAICVVEEAGLVDIDPWPALDAKLDEEVDHFILEGEESPRRHEVHEWLETHFGEDEFGGRTLGLWS